TPSAVPRTIRLCCTEHQPQTRSRWTRLERLMAGNSSVLSVALNSLISDASSHFVSTFPKTDQTRFRSIDPLWLRLDQWPLLLWVVGRAATTLSCVRPPRFRKE